MNSAAVIDREQRIWELALRTSEDGEILSRLLDGAPAFLAYAPVAQRNKFQALLYSQAHSSGFRVLPLSSPELFVKLPWSHATVCHFHWLQAFTASAQTEEEAHRAVQVAGELFQSIKNRGSSIVWTVHNVMPHESRWPHHDSRIRRILATAADVVHIMTRESQRLCSDYFELPEEKLLFIPHPAYIRAQPDWATAEEARAALGIPHDSFVFLSFGAILPYKGHEQLISEFEKISGASARRVHLAIAGNPADAKLANRLRAWAASRPDVTLDLRTIPNDDVQLYFRAADVAVCPYERTLNSGAAMMALSFNLPVVAPRTGAFVDNFTEDTAILYSPEDPDALARAMLNATRAPLGAMREACAALAAQLHPDTISRQFFSELRKRLSRTRGAPQ